MELEKAIAKIRAQMLILQEGVFNTPPSDWAEFKRRLGEYQGLKNAEGCIQEVLKEDLDDGE